MQQLRIHGNTSFYIDLNNFTTLERAREAVQEILGERDLEEMWDKPVAIYNVK